MGCSSKWRNIFRHKFLLYTISRLLVNFARVHSFDLIHSACPARLHSRRTGAISVYREVIYTAGKRSSHRNLTGGNVYA